MYKKIVGIFIVGFFIGAGALPCVDGEDGINSYLNNPPNTPNPPQGNQFPDTDDHWVYSIVTTDPDGDDIFYKISWGDGTETDWIGEFGNGHSAFISTIWNTEGIHMVRGKAKDIHGAESDWSDPLIVTVYKFGIERSSGGFVTSILVKNHGDYDYENVEWSIEFEGIDYDNIHGIVLFQGKNEGSIASFPSGGTEKLNAFVIGFGFCTCYIELNHYRMALGCLLLGPYSIIFNNNELIHFI